MFGDFNSRTNFSEDFTSIDIDISVLQHFESVNEQVQCEVKKFETSSNVRFK